MFVNLIVVVQILNYFVHGSYLCMWFDFFFDKKLCGLIIYGNWWLSLIYKKAESFRRFVNEWREVR